MRHALWALAALVAGWVVPRAESAPREGMWSKGSQWISLKAGYAKSSVRDAADGNVGFGVGYTRFFFPNWALGLQVHYEVLGRYSGPAEVEMPITVEAARHFNWPTQAKPYAGWGGGIFLHEYKFTQPGEESERDTRPGGYLLGGINVPVTLHSLLGVEGRMVVEMGAENDNPVFPSVDDRAIHWSVKLDYSLAL